MYRHILLDVFWNILDRLYHLLYTQRYESTHIADHLEKAQALIAAVFKIW